MKLRKREYFIIDGYNVINAWPELITLRENLDHARDRLIAIMAEYGAYEQYDVTIVFDALFTSSQQSYEQISPHLEVVFTGEGETADRYIEKLAYDLVRTGKEVYVVTSDWAEQMTILGAGAYRMSSRELLKAIKKAKKKISDEYTQHSIAMSRRELGCRINDDIAKKMDELRKRS